MSKLVQRPNRNGFYLVVPVPRKLRQRLGKSAVYRKAGDTRQEALRRRTALLVEIENEFRRALKEDVVAEVVKLLDPSHEDFLDVLDQTLRERGYRGGTDNLHTDKKLASQADGALSGTTDYRDWIQRRMVEESPSKSTLRHWTGRLESLAEWFGSDYLAVMTKEDAVKWKNKMVQEIKNSSLAVYIGTYKAFWNWLIGNGMAEVNIWEGLTRKLKVTTRQDHVSTNQLELAKKSSIERNDIGFWLQYYTGCRKGDHQGLRYSDINMSEGTIRFEQYVYGSIVRNLKGREKDERTIPIHPMLRQKLEQMLPEVISNNDAVPIWEDQYRARTDTFGDKWSDSFSKSYGFSSHKLRSYVVTQLISSNVSPYILHAITRHTVPGMSQVVSGYVRPTLEQLREIIGRLV